VFDAIIQQLQQDPRLKDFEDDSFLKDAEDDGVFIVHSKRFKGYCHWAVIVTD